MKVRLVENSPKRVRGFGQHDVELRGELADRPAGAVRRLVRIEQPVDAGEVLRGAAQRREPHAVRLDHLASLE